jgi:cytoskeletal protein CcmA (bactofilin family)
MIMWKARNDEPSVNRNPNPNPTTASASATSGVPAAAMRPAPSAAASQTGRSPENFRAQADIAHIGKSVLIKGELSGSEDLYLDGEVEGSIELKQHSLTIGPHGRVKANVHAREVIVHGKVEGNVRGDEKVELKKSSVLLGDIATQRIAIEEGAYFKGGIDIQKDGKSETHREKAFSAAAAGAGSGTTYSASDEGQGSKKFEV